MNDATTATTSPQQRCRRRSDHAVREDSRCAARPRVGDAQAPAGVGKRALEAGYKLGYRNSEVSLKRWVSAGAQNVYAVAP